MTKRQTRSELVRSNLELAKTSNAHVATVHLGDDMNLAFVIRAAACFGAKSVMVIGSLPPYRILRQLSVGLNNFIEIQQFSTPEHFLQHCREHNIAVFSIIQLKLRVSDVYYCNSWRTDLVFPSERKNSSCYRIIGVRNYIHMFFNFRPVSEICKRTLYH